MANVGARRPPSGGGGTNTEEATRIRDLRGERRPRVEEEEAGGGEHTVLFDAGRLRSAATPRAKLVGLGGRRRGVEYPLRGTEVTIGREQGNDVVIADISVSRHHARFRRAAEGWFISDAGGGNGTRVNGLAVEEALLHDGDVVELGTTELQFVEPPPPPPAQEASRPGEKSGPSPRVKKVAVGVGGFVVLLVALKLLLPSGSPAARLIGEKPRVDQFAVARKLILGEKWEEAKAALVQAQADDPDNPEIKRYLDTINAEIVNQRHLDRAKAAFGRSDLVETLREINQVGAGSLLSDDGAKLKARVDSAVASLVQQAKDDLDKGDSAAAKEHLDRALAAEPEQSQGLALLPRLRTAVAVAAMNARDRERAEAAEAARLRLEKGPVGQARNLFHAGDLGGAIAMLRTATGSDAAPAAQLMPSLLGFSSAWQRGKQAMGRNNGVAVVQLERAHGLAIRIGGDDGALAVSSGKLLAQIHDQLGRAARSARAMDKAYHHFSAALAANPGDAEAKENLARLRQEADELFTTAYGEMNMDPASSIRAFRLVIAMTDPSYVKHQKAEKWLAQLTGRAGDKAR